MRLEAHNTEDKYWQDKQQGPQCELQAVRGGQAVSRKQGGRQDNLPRWIESSHGLLGVWLVEEAMVSFLGAKLLLLL